MLYVCYFQLLSLLSFAITCFHTDVNLRFNGGNKDHQSINHSNCFASRVSEKFNLRGKLFGFAVLNRIETSSSDRIFDVCVFLYMLNRALSVLRLANKKELCANKEDKLITLFTVK